MKFVQNKAAPRLKGELKGTKHGIYKPVKSPGKKVSKPNPATKKKTAGKGKRSPFGYRDGRGGAIHAMKKGVRNKSKNFGSKSRKPRRRR